MKSFTAHLFMMLIAGISFSATADNPSATESIYSRLHRLASAPLQADSSASHASRKTPRTFPRRIYPTLDITGDVTGASAVRQGSPDMLPFTGKGVTVAVIDAGIDPTHIAFSDRGEGSRVVRYVRTESAAESESTELEVKIFTDMASITTDDIDTGCDGHGTHTAGIAAGTTDVSPYAGIAPDANLFLVSMGDMLYDDEITAGMKAALDYADESDTPLVMNFSLGSAVGNHRGDNPLTNICTEYPSEGRIPLFAAGNDGINALSLERDFSVDPSELATGMARVFAGTPAPSFYTEIYSADEKEFEVAFAILRLSDWPRDEIWRSEFITAADFQDGMAIILHPDMEGSALPGLENYFSGLLAVGLEQNESAPFSMGILGNFKDVDIDYPYVLSMIIRSPQGASVMAVTEYQQAYFRAYSVPGYVNGNADNSISDYCTSPYVVSVGAWNARKTWSNVCGEEHPLNEDFYGAYNSPGLYSSYGNVRTTDERLPHLLAPGTDVISAIPSFVSDEETALLTGNGDCQYKWGPKTGTSMATPAMAGIVALWLEACPTLTRDDIIKVVEATSHHDETTDIPQGSSYGKVDAYAGLRYILANISVPGVVTTRPHSRLMVRNFGNGHIECAVPFPCTSGTATVYSPSGAAEASQPLSQGAARFLLPSGIHIIKAVTPLGTATERVIIP